MRRPVLHAFALALALVPGPAWVAEAKAERVVLHVDEPPRVAESDEGNNRYVFK
jgi:hypothetical protein